MGMTGQMEREIKRELMDAQNGSKFRERRAFLEAYDVENGWRARGEFAIRAEMERAVGRRMARGPRR